MGGKLLNKIGGSVERFVDNICMIICSWTCPQNTVCFPPFIDAILNTTAFHVSLQTCYDTDNCRLTRKYKLLPRWNIFIIIMTMLDREPLLQASIFYRFFYFLILVASIWLHRSPKLYSINRKLSVKIWQSSIGHDQSLKRVVNLLKSDEPSLNTT